MPRFNTFAQQFINNTVQSNEALIITYCKNMDEARKSYQLCNAIMDGVDVWLASGNAIWQFAGDGIILTSPICYITYERMYRFDEKKFKSQFRSTPTLLLHLCNQVKSDVLKN